MQNRHLRAAQNDAAEALDRVNRLEITVAQLRDRLDQVEGSHAALSHSVRGRLGGRGNKAQQAPGAPLYVVPPAM